MPVKVRAILLMTHDDTDRDHLAFHPADVTDELEVERLHDYHASERTGRRLAFSRISTICPSER